METKREMQQQLVELMTQGPAETLNILRKVIRIGLDIELMIVAIAGTLEPRAAELMMQAIRAEAATGEPLPERPAVKQVSPIEQIKLLLLADLPPETAMLLIADVVMPKETAAAIGGSIVDGVWVPETLLGDVKPQAVANA
jgi:hypothetical protein